AECDLNCGMDVDLGLFHHRQARVLGHSRHDDRKKLRYTCANLRRQDERTVSRVEQQTAHSLVHVIRGKLICVGSAIEELLDHDLTARTEPSQPYISLFKEVQAF